MSPGEPGVYEVIGLSGDFPVQWILWKEFIRRVADGDSPKWFPTPGGAGFHDLKVGSIPALKQLMEGALTEDLIANGRAGLSKWYEENWVNVSNLRKNRRVNDCVLVASVLSAISTLRTEDHLLETALKRVWQESPGSVQDIIKKSNSVLKVSPAVTRKAYEDGLAIRESMLRFGDQFKNADLYLRVFILEMLVPVTGLQVVSRCGQTELYRKLYFSLSPFLMHTTKSSYQKASVQFIHMLTVLPDFVVADIFGGLPGAMVVNRGTNPYANIVHDETLELGVRRIKILPIRKMDPLLDSVNWIGELSRMESSMISAVRLDGVETSLENSARLLERDADGILQTYDREHGLAINAAGFLEHAEGRKQFSANNLKLNYLSNIMPLVPVVVKDVAKIDALLTMRETGLKKQCVLVSRIVPEYMEAVWRPEDLSLMGLSKQPAKRGAWTRSGAVSSMAKSTIRPQLLATTDVSTKSPLELDGDKCYSSFTKKWNSRIIDLLEIQNSSDSSYGKALRETVSLQLSRLNSISHVSTPLALCYREKSISVKPGYGLECRQKKARKSSFFRKLQELGTAEFQKSAASTIYFLKENISHPAGYDNIHMDVENVAHHGLQKSARSRTVGEVMKEQMEGQLRSLLLGARSEKLKHVYLHCDVSKWTVLQKGGTQACRDEKSTKSSDGSTTRAFDEEVDSATIQRYEKEGFTSGYLFYGAKAALDLNEKFNKNLQHSREISVFLFGGGFAIQKDALNADIDVLDIWRCPDDAESKVLIYRKDQVRPMLVAGSFDSDVRVYDQNNCFKVTKSNGISLHEQGENFHGEAETRIIFSHQSLTKSMRLAERTQPMQLQRRDGFSATRGNSAVPITLVVSNDSDCPAISTCCKQQLRGENFVHKVSNQFIFIDKLFDVLDFLKLDSCSLIAASALGGNDFCPGTEGVSQICYLQALLRRRALLRGWKALGKSGGSSAEVQLSDVEAVMLTVFSFLEVPRYASQVPQDLQSPKFIESLHEVPLSGARLADVWCQIEEWIVNVRKAVFKCSSVLSASNCIPETHSLKLQGRRASFVIKYWSGAYNAKWDRKAIGCVDETWGFCLDSNGDCWPLYENAESLRDTKQKLKLPFTSCGCKECKTRSCTCLRLGLVCLPGVCKKCASKCQNMDHHISRGPENESGAILAVTPVTAETSDAQAGAMHTETTISPGGVTHQVECSSEKDPRLEEAIDEEFFDDSDDSNCSDAINAKQFEAIYGESDHSDLEMDFGE